MPNRLANVIAPIAKQAIGKDWALYTALLEHWGDIVGKEYAQVTTPVKITFPHQPLEARRKGGTLTLRLPKGLAMEFTYKSEAIRQRVNSYFGQDVISRINLDTVPSLPAKKAEPTFLDEGELRDIEQQASSVEGDELRQALETLGKSVLASSKAGNLV